MKRVTVALVSSVCLILALVGCAGKDEKIAIEGVVFCDNKPIAGASVAFIGNEGGSYGTGVTDIEGKFTLRTVAGKNKVAVSKESPSSLPPPDPNADQSMPTEGEVAQMAKSMPKPLIAAKFADSEKSGIVIDVKPGMTPIDINVSSK